VLPGSVCRPTLRAGRGQESSSAKRWHFVGVGSMMRTVRLGFNQLLVGAVLVVVLVALGASATLGASNVKITNRAKASVRPKTLTLTCGDGNTVLSGLRWSSFGGSVARASGTFETNTCNPNCAQGKVVRYPVSVKASSPRSCKKGRLVYNKLALRFAARAPSSAGSFEHWTLGCPT
jgi:hypothetical protein